MKKIDEDFGWRYMSGYQREQSQCKKCRNLPPLMTRAERAELKAKEAKQAKKAKQKPKPVAATFIVTDIGVSEIKDKRGAADVTISGDIQDVILPTDRAELTVLYQHQFPGDKNGNKRSVKFMTDKLLKKLQKPVEFKVLPPPTELLEGI